MLVRDRRHVTNLDHMFAECLEHQRLATADGSLKTVMTVFKARQPGTRLGIRLWGQQLIRFACYDMPDGSLMGDKANLQYTKECIEFGWKPPEPRTEFDVLPVVLDDTATGETRMFEVPREYHKVTMIEHPNFPEFAKLGLRWCVVPTM
jgi:nitric oxide synthase oxygenase domain/subunit